MGRSKMRKRSRSGFVSNTSYSHKIPENIPFTPRIRRAISVPSNRNLNEKGLRVYIPLRVYQKMLALTMVATSETSAMGVVHLEKDGERTTFGQEIWVDDIHYVHNTSSSASTTLDAGDLSRLQIELMQSGIDLLGFRLWFHTHYNFNVFWSGTDKNTAINVLENSRWTLSIVMNQKQELLARVDKYRPTHVEYDNVPIYIVNDVRKSQWDLWCEEAKSKINTSVIDTSNKILSKEFEEYMRSQGMVVDNTDVKKVESEVEVVADPFGIPQDNRPTGGNILYLPGSEVSDEENELLAHFGIVEDTIGLIENEVEPPEVEDTQDTEVDGEKTYFEYSCSCGNEMLVDNDDLKFRCSGCKQLFVNNDAVQRKEIENQKKKESVVVKVANPAADGDELYNFAIRVKKFLLETPAHLDDFIGVTNKDIIPPEKSDCENYIATVLESFTITKEPELIARSDFYKRKVDDELRFFGSYGIFRMYYSRKTKKILACREHPTIDTTINIPFKSFISGEMVKECCIPVLNKNGVLTIRSLACSDRSDDLRYYYNVIKKSFFYNFLPTIKDERTECPNTVPIETLPNNDLKKIITSALKFVGEKEKTIRLEQRSNRNGMSVDTGRDTRPSQSYISGGTYKRDDYIYHGGYYGGNYQGGYYNRERDELERVFLRLDPENISND